MQDVRDSIEVYRTLYDASATAHYKSSEYKVKIKKWLGIPVIIITAVTGASVLSDIQPFTDFPIKLFTGILAFIGTILAYLQTFLHYTEDAEKHKAAGEIYRSVSRSFEILGLKYAKAEEGSRGKACSEIKLLVDSIKDAAKAYPVPLDKYFQEAKSKKENDVNIRSGSQLKLR